MPESRRIRKSSRFASIACSSAGCFFSNSRNRRRYTAVGTSSHIQYIPLWNIPQWNFRCPEKNPVAVSTGSLSGFLIMEKSLPLNFLIEQAGMKSSTTRNATSSPARPTPFPPEPGLALNQTTKRHPISLRPLPGIPSRTLLAIHRWHRRLLLLDFPFYQRRSHRSHLRAERAGPGAGVRHPISLRPLPGIPSRTPPGTQPSNKVPPAG